MSRIYRHVLVGVAVVLAASFQASADGGTDSQKDDRPVVVALRHIAKPVAGAPATLVIVGRDRDGVIVGARVNFGDGSEQILESSCRLGNRTRRAGRSGFRVPHTYANAGSYRLRVRITSVACSTKGIPVEGSQPQTSAVATLFVGVRATS